MQVDLQFLLAALAKNLFSRRRQWIDSGGGIVSDMVTGTCVEKYGTNAKECDISRQQILPCGGIIAPLSFLCSRIPNKDTL